MWKLIVKKKIPPTRLQRYCCVTLKEQGGKDRFVMTGVRWAESNNRKKNRGSLEMGREMILNADNNDSRREFETCIKKSKRLLNPIVDWLDNDVWGFLGYYGCKSNPLYECGYKRVGCIGCPMAGKGRIRQFEQYPKYKNLYIKAFQRMVDTHGYAEISSNWTSGEAVFDWWMNEKRIPKELEGQLSIDDI